MQLINQSKVFTTQATRHGVIDKISSATSELIFIHPMMDEYLTSSETYYGASDVEIEDDEDEEDDEPGEASD